MFTGLVEETGKVIEITAIGDKSVRMCVEADIVTQNLSIGDSVAVNGCCLTAVSIEGKKIAFDLLAETVRCTSFNAVTAGSLVNLERSLAVGDRMGGHFVTGHVDGLGTVKSMEKEGDDYVLTVEAPEDLRRYLVYKGSVSIDGISLTVASVKDDCFTVCLIPHTVEVTNLKARKKGDAVNLESDMLAKYVERIIEARQA